MFDIQARNHPLIGKIPADVFLFIFGHQIDNNELSRMVGSLEESSAKLTADEDPLKSLLCVIYSHSDNSDEELLIAARNMGASDEIIASAAMISGKKHLLHTLSLSKEQLISLMEADNCQILLLVVYNGDLIILDYLLEISGLEKSREMIAKNNCHLVASAALSGNVHVFNKVASVLERSELIELIVHKKYVFPRTILVTRPVEFLDSLCVLLGRDRLSAILVAEDYQLFVQAASTYRTPKRFYDLLQFLNPDQVKAMSTARDYGVFIAAVENNNWNIINWLFLQTDRAAMLAAKNYHAFCFTATTGNRRLFLHLAMAVTTSFAWINIIQSVSLKGFKSAQSKDDLLARDKIIEVFPAHYRAIVSAWMKSGRNGSHDDFRGELPPLLQWNKKSARPGAIKKNISGLVIKSPVQHCIYEIKCDGLPNNALSISIKGNKLPKQVDLSASFLNFSWSRDPRDNYTVKNAYSFETNQTLPLGVHAPFPLFAYSYLDHSVKPITRLHYNSNNNSLKIDTVALKENVNLEWCNDTLEEECQILADMVPVKTGKHPIFKAKQRPDFDFLSNLYKQFWRYNKKKLHEQYLNSADRCHVRAHFVSIVLRYYGIESVKVIKLWHWGDWATYDRTLRWDFHCATMIIDSNNDKWVWDPWIGFHAKLLTFQQWLFDKDSPKPKEVIILNRGILAHKAENIPDQFFDCHKTHHYRNTFQAVFGSAIPNPPEKPLTLPHQLTFFSPGSKIAQEHTNIETTAYQLT